MKTHISEFCTEFSEALFPLSTALGDAVRTIDSIDGSPDGMSEGLANVMHRLDALVNKVQGQEAYVLLFGPLKSGKSTLINAISSGYVSEVTSLPAYPCMVYLKYGPAPKYSVIRYSGKQEFLDSPEALKDLLEQSHRTLSDRIRSLDDFGETFDPAAHLPSAIRRVHVELPVENLRESGTVLVDTPGLYSKMKFGYDYMTQEFRDSAACAVFIVKTDNLFLEQVFTDFNDLLDQFSRVFVVVNIDTGKSDLCPDGSLEPSLESRDPDQIVQAFEVLTMSAPLRRAADSGRLHIYPIDLRSSAAKRLSAGDDGSVTDDEPDRFDDFLNDLMKYLNSTDYLLEFMSDTIRQSAKLSDEIIAQCESDAVNELATQREAVDQAKQDLLQKRDAARRVTAIDWAASLQPALDRDEERRKASAAELLSSTAQNIRHFVSNWFQTDEPLDQLRGSLGLTLNEAVAAACSDAEQGFSSISNSAFGGATMDAKAVSDLAAIGLDVVSSVQKSAASFQLPSVSEIPPPDLAGLPVKRSLADKVLFRSAENIRKKFEESSGEKLPAKVKQKRFAANAEDAVVALGKGLLNQR